MAAADDAYKKALKQIDDLVKKQKLLNKSTDDLTNSWTAIASQLFKIDQASFFKDVKKTPEEVAKIGEAVLKLQSDFKTLGKVFSDSLDSSKKAQMMRESLVGAFDDVKKASASFQGDFESKAAKSRELQEAFNKKLTRHWENLKKDNHELATVSDDIAKTILEQIASGKKFEDILLTTGDAGRQILASMTDNKTEALEFSKAMGQAADGAEALKKSAIETNKEFSTTNFLTKGIAKNIQTSMFAAMTNFDAVLHKVQRDTGVLMDSFAHEEAFSKLTTEVSQFGVSAEKAGEIFSNIAEQINTTDFSVLSQATKDISMVEGATGAAAENVTNLTGAMMRMGASSQQVHDTFQDTADIAKKFNVSSKSVIDGIAKNIAKFKNMGFQGGEKSLAKMVATAQRLRMSVDSVFDMADKARNIEGAMDMAAELQLAGGSFSNINPMDLLAAARKGPAELQKILTSMGKDIGKFNAEGKFEIDAVDTDRLRMVAEATGAKFEDLRNQIEKTAEDSQKLAGISEDVFANAAKGVEGWDADMAKSTLSDMMEKTKDGKIVMKTDSVDLFKQAGITDLKNINDEQLKKLIQFKEDDKKTLEEQNKNNQTLKESFDNLIQGVMSVFTIFQPALDFLGSVLREVGTIFAAMPGWGKNIVAGLMVFGLLFSTSVGSFITKGIGGMAKNVMGLKDMFSAGGGGAKGLMAKIGEKFNPTTIKTPETKGGVGGLSEEIKNASKSGSKIDMSGVLKFAAAMALIGVAVAAFGFGINQMGGIGMLDILGKGAIAIGLLAGTVLLISQLGSAVNVQGVLTLSIAMGLIGLAMIPFAFAAKMMTGVDWMSVLKGVGVMSLVMIGLGLLGTLALSVGFLIVAGAAILAIAGVALMAAAGGLLMTASAFDALSKIDWSGFTAMGDALMSVVPGMLGFSLAAMMFANPITLLGIMFMVGALSGLVSVMGPLAQSLTLGADSLDRFASGLEKLSVAADKLSLEKLEKLKELSDAMANSSAGAAMAAVANTANAAAGAGGAGGGEVRRIEVDVKMNGRDLQNFIVKDTALLK